MLGIAGCVICSGDRANVCPGFVLYLETRPSGAEIDDPRGLRTGPPWTGEELQRYATGVDLPVDSGPLATFPGP